MVVKIVVRPIAKLSERLDQGQAGHPTASHAVEDRWRCYGCLRGAPGRWAGRAPMAQSRPLRLARLSSSLFGKGFDGHEAQPVAGGLVAVDDPTECKVAYLVVVSHPAGETVAHLIDKFLQRRFAQCQ
jgi:hypothetical protein